MHFSDSVWWSFVHLRIAIQSLPDEHPVMIQFLQFVYELSVANGARNIAPPTPVGTADGGMIVPATGPVDIGIPFIPLTPGVDATVPHTPGDAFTVPRAPGVDATVPAGADGSAPAAVPASAPPPPKRARRE